jgi:hypothetical protein
MEDYIIDSEYAEEAEIERQCGNIADRINFEEKLSPEWIEKNVEVLPSYGRDCYDYDSWIKAVENETKEGIELLAHCEIDRIHEALREADKRIPE